MLLENGNIMVNTEYYYNSQLILKGRFSCFSDLRTITCNETRFFIRYAVKPEVRDFYFNRLKAWGFNFEFTRDYIQVKEPNWFKMSLTLMLTRYIHKAEEGVPLIIETLYQESLKDPQLDLWAAFQVIHYKCFFNNYFNANHTLLGIGIKKIISLTDFWERVNKSAQESFKSGIFDSLTGYNYDKSNETSELIKSGTIQELIQKLS